jgi:hypothetical protein
VDYRSDLVIRKIRIFFASGLDFDFRDAHLICPSGKKLSSLRSQGRQLNVSRSSTNKKAAPFYRGGKTRLYADNFFLCLGVAVMLGMMTAGFGVMMLGVAGVAVRAVGVMGRLFVVAGFMMLGSFAMVLRGMLVVFGSLVVMLDACVVAHVSSPGLAI